jgi:hypothetical protein
VCFVVNPFRSGGGAGFGLLNQEGRKQGTKSFS